MSLLMPSIAWWLGGIACLVAAVWYWVRRTITPVYWCAVLCCGLWIGYQAQSTGVGAPRSWSTDMPAVLTGTVQRIIREDSVSVRCIVRGTLDAQALPAYRDVGMVLTIVQPNAKREVLAVGNRIYAQVRARVPQLGTLPGEWNERMYYSSLDVQWLAIATGKHVALLQRGTPISTLPQRLAGAVGKRVQELFPHETEGIARALLIGDKSGMSTERRQVFSLAGTAHVLAVSGLHVGVVAVVLLVVFGRIRPAWLRFVVFALVLCSYALVTGLQPSMIRATTMAILLLLLHLLQREGHLFNVLCAAVVCMLLMQPYVLYSVGFYLSVASLVGIALLYPIVEGFWLRIFSARNAVSRFLATSLAVSLSASAVVAPLVAMFFGVYSLIAPLANIAVVPLMSLGMVYSLCAVLSSLVSGSVAMLFVASADMLFRVAEALTAFAASLPFAAVQGKAAVWLALAASAATLYVCCAHRIRLAAFRAVVALVLVVLTAMLTHSDGTKKLVLIPRGQVAVALIPAEPKHSVVVLQDRKPGLYPRGDRGLERWLADVGDTLTVVASGPAALYCASQFRTVPLRAVIVPSLRYKTPKFWRALDSLEKRGIRVVNAQQYVHLCTSMVFYETGKERVEWDVWRNVLTCVHQRNKREISLPQLSRFEDIALER